MLSFSQGEWKRDIFWLVVSSEGKLTCKTEDCQVFSSYYSRFEYVLCFCFMQNIFVKCVCDNFLALLDHPWMVLSLSSFGKLRLLTQCDRTKCSKYNPSLQLYQLDKPSEAAQGNWDVCLIKGAIPNWTPILSLKTFHFL